MEKTFWKDRRVFVTGGAGFIGGHLVDRLLSLGADIRLFIHKKQYTPLVSSLIGDLTDPFGLKEYLQEFQPEVVYHLAAQPIVGTAAKSDIETNEINIRGTYQLLSACRLVRSIKCFVHVSTDKVYGNTDLINYDTPLNGSTHPYNASKSAGDVLAQMYANFYNVPVAIVRHGNIYGPRDLHWGRIIPRTIHRVLQNERPVIRGDGKSLRDYIYVSDIIDAYLGLVEKNFKSLHWPKKFIYGSKRPYSVLEVIDTVLKVMRRIDLAPTFEDLWPGEIPNQHINLTNWNPKLDLEDGLEATVPYYMELLKSHG